MKNIAISLFILLSININGQTEAEIKTAGITSPMHEKYMSKIVFSKSEIKMGNEIEANFINETTFDESSLYFRAYFKTSLYGLMKPGCSEPINDYLSSASFYYRFTLDGKEVAFESDRSDNFDKDEKLTWTTFRGSLISSKSLGQSIGDKQFKNFLVAAGDLLTVGSHVLKIDLIPTECANFKNKNTEIRNVAASGELKINITNDFLKKIFTRYLPFPPGSSLVNEEFTKIIKDKFKSESWGTIYKIELWDKAWVIEKNQYGITLNRHFSAVIAFKNPKGEYIYDLYKVTQEYVGSSFQKNIKWEWENNSRLEEFRVPGFYIKN